MSRSLYWTTSHTMINEWESLVTASSPPPAIATILYGPTSFAYAVYLTAVHRNYFHPVGLARAHDGGFPIKQLRPI